MSDYFRQFIMLSGENRDTGRGRIIIEARLDNGKASLTAQGLAANRQFCLIFLVKDNDNCIGLDLGTFWTDFRGRIEGRFPFNPSRLLNSSYNIHNLEGVLVANANAEEIHPVLLGYKNAVFSWRSNFSMFKEDEQKPQAQTFEVFEPEVPIEEEVPFEEPVEFEEPIEPIEEPIEHIEPIEELIEPIPVQTPFLANFDPLFETESTIDIFETQNSIWIATTPETLAKSCELGLKLSENKIVKRAYERHKHIILGKIEEDGKKGYIIGAPDIYKSIDAFEIQQEFGSFRSIHSDGLSEGTHGYWLKEINDGI